jgi:hypothetical protein
MSRVEVEPLLLPIETILIYCYSMRETNRRHLGSLVLEHRITSNQPPVHLLYSQNKQDDLS